MRPNEAGQTIVHWEVISGALASHEGADTPRDFSPCGLCLDAGTTILLSRPERVFTYLRGTLPSIVEDLIVPLYDTAGKPLGTLWVAHHDPASCFCSDDARIMEQLAVQLMLALRLLEQATEHRHAVALLESHQMAERTLLAHDLAEERSLREQAEASERQIRQTLLFKDAMMHEVHHRANNSLQMAASLLSLHARATTSAQVRATLQENHGRLHLLAKVHELLDAGAGSTQAVLMPTLLQAIGDAMRRSFAEKSPHVQLRVMSDEIMLPADDAIPLALLANEVLTNACQHSFPAGCPGEISLSLRRAPENALILQIADTGIDRAKRSNGLRLQLIQTFAAQLRGTLSFAKPAGAVGTSVTLTIHRGASRERSGAGRATNQDTVRAEVNGQPPS